MASTSTSTSTSTSRRLVQYSSESDSEGSSPGPALPPPKRARLDPLVTTNSAPDTTAQSTSSAVAVYDLVQVSSKALTHNVPYAALSSTVAGPANPMAPTDAYRRAAIGVADEFAMDSHEFKQQLRRFTAAQVHGAAPTTASSDLVPTARTTAAGVPYIADEDAARAAAVAARAAGKRRRKPMGDPAETDGAAAYRGPWAGFMDDDLDDDDEVDHSHFAMAATTTTGDWTVEEDAAAVPSHAAHARLITPGAERSVFHGTAEHDYQGRTYMHPPTVAGVDLTPGADPPTAFLPKRCLHTYRGHSKGVNAIRLLPGTGHLLLSASMDGKVKLWDVHNDRRVLRTFLGHNKAVRDIAFAPVHGKSFLSAGFDRYVKTWDTETGACTGAFTSGKVPLCVTYHPDQPHLFLAGQQDKKIVQYDTRSGEITQEYDQHLGPVNSITFVDHNRRFVTTSDDKSLRAWEFDIPVVIKYVAEPHMHSMPAVTLSPNKKWLACQSMDNQILLYGATDNFRLNRKKSFRGHMVAGYAAQVGFSADGQYVMSGDSTGTMFFWDFKTCKLIK
ncbi:WD40-repeat-containing domain protein, partial [Blastocladiella britannica]